MFQNLLPWGDSLTNFQGCARAAGIMELSGCRETGRCHFDGSFLIAHPLLSWSSTNGHHFWLLPFNLLALLVPSWVHLWTKHIQQSSKAAPQPCQPQQISSASSKAPPDLAATPEPHQSPSKAACHTPSSSRHHQPALETLQSRPLLPPYTVTRLSGHQTPFNVASHPTSPCRHFWPTPESLQSRPLFHLTQWIPSVSKTEPLQSRPLPCRPWQSPFAGSTIWKQLRSQGPAAHSTAATMTAAKPCRLSPSYQHTCSKHGPATAWRQAVDINHTKHLFWLETERIRKRRTKKSQRQQKKGNNKDQREDM